MHLWRMFSKKEFEGKGWLMRQKEELIWDRRGAEREHRTNEVPSFSFICAKKSPHLCNGLSGA